MGDYIAKVTRSVQYRFLNRKSANIGTRKLQDVLLSALAEKRDGDVIGAKARARIADLNQSGQLTLWNGIQGGDGGQSVLAGELVLYRQGFDVPAIEEKLDDEENRFELVRFQTDGKSKPVEGTLYFAIIGDHVGLIQSNSVTSTWLERYLTWMLKDITSHIEGESVIHLDQKIELAEPDAARLGPAKALTLHASPEQRPTDGATTDTAEPSREFRTKRRGKGTTVVEILRLLGLGEDTIESIRADIPAGGSLEGDFLVFIKRGRKREQISVGTIGHVLRNTDPTDIAIERRGSKARGNLQTLSEPVRVQEAPMGLDPNDAIESIVAMLYRWNKLGVINLGPPE